MKKVGYLGLSLMLIALVTGSALAEIPAGFNLSGAIDAPYTYRSKELNTFLNGELTTSDFILSPLFTVNTRWDLKSKVTVFGSFENRRLVSVPTAASRGTGTPTEFGGGVNMTPAITQAYIKVNEFLSPKLAMTYGIQDLNFTLRKGEGAFFMHPAASLSPSNAIPLDMNAVLRTNPGVSGIPEARIKGVSEFSGFNFNFGSMKDDNYALCVFWGKTLETVIAPGTAAVSGQRNEDLLLGANLAYKLPGENNVLKVLLSQMTNPSTNMSIMTLGVGADYFGAMPNLEIYGEAYTQSGTFCKDTTPGNTSFGKDVDQAAMAYRVGGQYNFANSPIKPWIGISYWFIDGGNDSNVYKLGSTKYTENNHFISYEDVQSTMILEDNLWGLNLNSNYNAIKIEAGITTSLTLAGEKKNLDLKLLAGSFTLNKVPWVRNPGVDNLLYTPDDVAQKTKDALGTEIDIVASLRYTENLTISLGLGMLTGGNFFDSIEVDDANNTTKRLDNESFDSMTMVTFGANVKF